MNMNVNVNTIYNNLVTGCVNNANNFRKAFKRRLIRRPKQSSQLDRGECHDSNLDVAERIEQTADNLTCTNGLLQTNNINTDAQNVGNCNDAPCSRVNQLLNEELRDWARRARKYQQANYNSLGDRTWDLIETEDMLEKKLGFALFGIPMDSKGNETILNYSKEQNERIVSIKNHIITLHKSINQADCFYMACIFVHLFLKGKEKREAVDVIFRIPKSLDKEQSSHLFIDVNCRTYDTWDDYLNKNRLPKCYMCYPLNGIYSADRGMVNLHLKESAACKTSKTVLARLDVTSTVLTLGATGVGIAALAVPIATPLVLGATATAVASGAYDIGRCVNKLMDIRKHRESLGLKNPESRGAWIGLAASAMGVASIGGTAVSRSMLKGEQMVSRASAMTLRIINVSSVAINGVSVLNQLVTIVMKYLNGTISTSDVLQFKWACYFFVNAIVSYDMADRLIKDAAISDITDLFNMSKNCVYKFTKSALEFTDSSTYNVLRALVLGTQPPLIPNIDFNKLELTVHKMLVLINRQSEGSIGWTKFALEMSETLDCIWDRFKDVIIKSMDELCCLFRENDWKSYVVKSGCKPFMHSGPDIARQFSMCMHKTVAYCHLDDNNVEYINDILSLINDFSNFYPSDHSAGFLNRSKYICECLERQFDNTKESYASDIDLETANAVSSENGIDLRSDCFQGIADTNVYLFKKALEELDLEAALKEFDHSCYAIANVGLYNTPCLETSVSSHYVFNGPAGSQALTVQQYWQQTNDITDAYLNAENSTLMSQNGVVLITPNNADCDIKAVIFYSSYEKDCVMGFASVLRRPLDTDGQQQLTAT